VPSTTPRATPSAAPQADPAAAIPSYGSAPPPSVAATLKSISEFTIVEATEETGDLPSAAGTAPYERPIATPGVGSIPGDTVLADEPEVESMTDGRVAEIDSEADRLFDSPDARAVASEPLDTVEAEANDDVIAAAFGGSTPVVGGSPEVEEQAADEPTFIGGDPSTRFAAESLEEIARGIRAGEIRLPAIDPAAEQSAVLAAVLAAILAPRR